MLIDDPKAQAASLRLDGYNNCAIANLIGVSEATVRRWLGSKPKSKPQDIEAAIRGLKSQGYDEAVIRANFG